MTWPSAVIAGDEVDARIETAQCRRRRFFDIEPLIDGVS
jgi:hypothetical protein